MVVFISSVFSSMAQTADEMEGGSSGMDEVPPDLWEDPQVVVPVLVIVVLLVTFSWLRKKKRRQ